MAYIWCYSVHGQLLCYGLTESPPTGRSHPRSQCSPGAKAHITSISSTILSRPPIQPLAKTVDWVVVLVVHRLATRFWAGHLTLRVCTLWLKSAEQNSGSRVTEVKNSTPPQYRVWQGGQKVSELVMEALASVLIRRSSSQIRKQEHKGK